MTQRYDKHERISSAGRDAGRRPRRVLWLLAVLAGLGLQLPGCLGALGASLGGETLEWKEEVALHDGGTVIVSRWLQLVPGEPFKTMPGPRRLSFTHPTTGESIVWENAGKIGSRVIPGMLDFDAGRPILVTMAQEVTDYNDLGCPTPPYIVFRYEAGTWTRIPLAELPRRIMRMNLIGYPDRDFLKANGYFIRAAVTAKEYKDLPGDDYSLFGTVDRRIRNPISLSCRRGTIERIYGVEKYQEWRGTGNWLGKSEDEALRLLHGKSEGGKP